MRRREFLKLSSAVAAGWTIPARAQQARKAWRIGLLTPRTRPAPPARDAFSEAFIRGMSDLGYVEGNNLLIAWRYADGVYTRLAGFANELVGMNPPVIVTYGTAA